MREERLIYDEIHKEQIQEKAKQWKAANRDRINELKLLYYHNIKNHQQKKNCKNKNHEIEKDCVN